MQGQAPQSWWVFTDERKHKLQQKAYGYVELADCH
jgi:cbb3-type cytochrome oxidase subunit 3